MLFKLLGMLVCGLCLCIVSGLAAELQYEREQLEAEELEAEELEAEELEVLEAGPMTEVPENGESLYELGQMYYEGDSVERDWIKAAEYFQQAWAAGHEASVLSLVRLRRHSSVREHFGDEMTGEWSSAARLVARRQATADAEAAKVYFDRGDEVGFNLEPHLAEELVVRDGIFALITEEQEDLSKSLPNHAAVATQPTEPEIVAFDLQPMRIVSVPINGSGRAMFMLTNSSEQTVDIELRIVGAGEAELTRELAELVSMDLSPLADVGQTPPPACVLSVRAFVTIADLLKNEG